MKVTIDRKKWLRGSPRNEDGVNYLWDKDLDAGCCLGHVCIQLYNKTTDELDGRGNPSVLGIDTALINAEPGWSGAPSSFVIDAVDINDTKYREDEFKEESLIKLFKKNGVELEFYN